MTARMLLTGCAAALILVSAPFARAGATEDAAKAFADGKALLAKADFAGAQKAFAAAAKADRDKPEYMQQYAMLRKVILLRDALPRETNAEKWQLMARSLRSYYLQNKVYSEALALDQKVHAKLNNTDSAVSLAQTQLAMGLNADAARLLGAIEEKAATPESRILLGIALAREKKMDEARAIAAKVDPPADAGSGLYYDTACLRALTGDTTGALLMLTRAFELTPPSRLDSVKAGAKEDKDLASLVSSPEFAKVMKTESKVKESSCSGGSDCGSCPSRSGCNSAKGAASCARDDKAAGPTEKK